MLTLRNNKKVSRIFMIVSRNDEKASRIYKIVSRYFIIIIRNNENTFLSVRDQKLN